MHRFLLQQLVYFNLISLCFPNSNKEKVFVPLDPLSLYIIHYGSMQLNLDPNFDVGDLKTMIPFQLSNKNQIN